MQTTVHSKHRKTARRSQRGIESLEQRIAPAGIFRWNATGGGAWNNPSNWQLIEGDLTDLSEGFPNDADDTAQLTNAITGNATINIPNNVEIALGTLIFNDNNSYTITASGSGKLILGSNLASGSLKVETTNGSATHTIQAPIQLNGDLEVTTTSASPLVLQTGITEGAGSARITKNGSGELQLAGAGANTYSGGTVVNQGILRLAKNDGFSAVGNGSLTIGAFENPVGAATVVLSATEQIGDSQGVAVYDNGRLDLAGFTETVSEIFLIDSAEVVTGAGTLVTSSVSAASYGGASIATITGSLELTGSGTVRVEGTVPDTKLVISAVIKGTDGLRKDGSGTLELTTTSSQLYTGPTVIADGTLLLNTVTSDRGISDTILIGSGATLRIGQTFEVPDTAKMIIAGGTLEVAATEDILDLTMSNATIKIASGQDFRIRKDGSVTTQESATFGGSLITGGGEFGMNEGAVRFEIGETPGTDSLVIETRVIGINPTAGLIKSGPGNLVLNADGTFLGGITLEEGTLALGGEQASAVALTGGLLTRSANSFLAASVAGITGNGGRIASMGSFASDGNLNLSAGLTFSAGQAGFLFPFDVTGTVSLGSAALDFTAFIPPSGNTPQVMIANDGTDAVTGTFQDLPEGSKVITPRGNYTISYTGGDGNDVTLTPVLVTPTILPGGKVATFTDADGDLVRVSVTKGTLTPDNFKLVEAGLGARVSSILLNDAGFAGANVKITATPSGGLGDRSVDIAFFSAGVDLGTVNIGGDIGGFNLGATGTATPAFKSFVVNSLGANNQTVSVGSLYVGQVNGGFGLFKVKGNLQGMSVNLNAGAEKAGAIAIGGSIVPGDANANVTIGFTGALGKMAIGGNVIGGDGVNSTVRITGSVGQLAIGGDIIGGSGTFSGQVRIEASAVPSSIKVAGSIFGGSGDSSGAIVVNGAAKSIRIADDVLGGEGTDSGRISVAGNLALLSVGGDIRGGEGSKGGTLNVGGTLAFGKITGSVIAGTDSFHSFGRIGSLAIGRDLAGTSAERIAFAIAGTSNPGNLAEALAIGSLSIGRHVQNADILAGYTSDSTTPSNADVQIGKVGVKGNWSASNLAAGVRSVDGLFGNSDDALIAGGSSDIASRIASIVIGGTVRGSITPNDCFGFVAQEIGSMQVAGKKLPLTTNGWEKISFGSLNDAFAREI